MRYPLKAETIERISMAQGSPNASNDYTINLLGYNIVAAEANLIMAIQRGFDTVPYEIRLGKLQAKMFVALEELVTGEHELSEKVLTQIAINRTAAGSMVQGTPPTTYKTIARISENA
jgi:hypothetical protein